MEGKELARPSPTDWTRDFGWGLQKAVIEIFHSQHSSYFADMHEVRSQIEKMRLQTKR